MYLSVTAVKPLPEYRLHLTFENGAQRIFNVSEYLDHGIFSELRNLNVFNSVHVSYDSIAWNNGADLDPEILFEKSTPAIQKSA